MRHESAIGGVVCEYDQFGWGANSTQAGLAMMVKATSVDSNPLESPAHSYCSCSFTCVFSLAPCMSFFFAQFALCVFCLFMHMYVCVALYFHPVTYMRAEGPWQQRYCFHKTFSLSQTDITGRSRAPLACMCMFARMGTTSRGCSLVAYS